MSNETTVFYIDGGCLGNEQKYLSLRRMISVVADDKGNVLQEIKNDGGSNNIAEFIALKYALQYAINHGIGAIKIITDSKNNIAWFNGKKIGRKVNDYAQTKAIKDEIEILKTSVKIEIEWKDREENLAGHYIGRG